MRRPLLITGLGLLFFQQTLFAQITLNWSSSFSPSWSNGALSRTAQNISGNSIHCTATVSMTGPGSFSQAMGSSGSQTPTVSGAVFTVPGSASRVQVTPNFNNNSSYSDIVLDFTALTNNVSFRIVDIDKSSATSDTYFDRVTITGSDGITTYFPTITRYDAVTDPDFLVISGNTAYVNTVSGQAGNTASDGSDQRGTVNIDFGSAVINSVTIRYDNAPGCDNNPAVQSIAVGNISFTQFTLPVRLTNFSGYRRQQDVILEWTTSQEYNSSLFAVERSNGNNGWERIGTVTAAGFSYSDLHYSFRDPAPPGALLLYRLKQTDLDDHYKYSNIVRIHSGTDGSVVKVYPNPFVDKISISLDSRIEQRVFVTVSDAAGKNMIRVYRNLIAGSNNILLGNLGQLAKGNYYISISDAEGNELGHSKLIRE